MPIILVFLNGLHPPVFMLLGHLTLCKQACSYDWQAYGRRSSLCSLIRASSRKCSLLDPNCSDAVRKIKLSCGEPSHAAIRGLWSVAPAKLLANSQHQFASKVSKCIFKPKSSLPTEVKKSRDELFPPNSVLLAKP